MPGQPVVLDSFGGLVCSARPEDIPEGASPRTHDSDFIVGRVVQRGGLQNQYAFADSSLGPNGGSAAADMPGTDTIAWTNPANILLNDASFATVALSGRTGQDASDFLHVTGFGFAIPSTASITGIEVSIKGFTSGLTIGSVQAQLIVNGVVAGQTHLSRLNLTNGFVILGSDVDMFGLDLAFSDINNINFGVSLQGLTDLHGFGSFISLDFVEITVFVSPDSANFNGEMSYKNQKGTQYTLALDANGTTFQENVSTTPNVLAVASLVPPVTPGAYLKGITVNDSAYMAYSDLTQGISMPMQYNGQWCDRITQVGPGAPPQFSASQSAGSQVAVTAWSFAGGILTLTTATQAYTAGEILLFSGFTGGLVPLNGLSFSILGTGLTTTQIQIATSLVVGAGADTGVATPQYTYPIVASPLGIVQPPAMSDPGDPGHFQALLWSAGPGSKSTGNVITVYYSNQFSHAQPDQTLVNAVNAGFPVYVYISGAPFGNGTWQVTSVGSDVPPGAEYARWYFTYQMPTTNYQFIGGPDTATGTYQQTSATVTTTTAVPNLSPGDQVSLQGVTNPAWDNTYTIIQSLNSGTYAITQTALDGLTGIATYTWALQSGAAPAAGDLVTVSGTLNANGTLNVVNAVIATATGVTTGTFTVNGFPAVTTYPTTVENGEAVTAGTKFVIDPGAALVNTTAQSPILGNSGDGTLTVVGSAGGGTFPIGAGTRQGVVFFVTRNGAVTRPSPPFTFTVATGANYITASFIPIGPPNVVARGIAFTEAGQNGVPGANFYTYSQPDIFTVGGIQYTATALFINDNTTTTAKFTFSDAVLLSSLAIDIPGNNYFALMEIGNPAWIFQYASRVQYGLCQSKIQNLLNPTFDGGYLPNSSTPAGIVGGTALLPLGWDVDPNYAFRAHNAIQLLTSPLFGNSLLLSNTTGSTQAILGMITQSAYRDAYQAPIIFPNVAYSVRITARTTSGPAGGFLNVDLVDSNNGIYGTQFGIFSCQPISSVFQTFIGTLIPATPSIPAGLLLRVSASGIPNGADFEIDRIEVFPTDRPIDNTTIWTSYAGNPEAVDEDTGSLGVGGENPQPAVGAFEILNQLFIQKTASLLVTQDSPNYEPAQWTVHQASDKSGAVGPNAFDFGEEWGLMANRKGIFAFDGGSPMVISSELQANIARSSIWEALDWNVASKFWVRNDLTNRRFFVGVAMPTPNFWLPNTPTPQAVFALASVVINPIIFPPSPPVTQFIFTFTGTLPPMAIGQTYTFSGLTAVPSLNGMTLTPLSISGAVAIFEAQQSFLASSAPETGSALITPIALTSPNVILMCNYNDAPSYGEMVAAAPVHTTMFGDLKALDMRRKWSIWQIPCPIAEAITRPDTFSDPLFFCNGIGSSKIYQVIPGDYINGQNTDDGAQIDFRYCTYRFVKAKQGQQLQGLGALRTVWYYLAARLEGVGQLAATLYSNTLGATYPFTIPLPFTLTYPAQDDQERVLEIGGQGVFVEFTSVGSGGYAEIGPVILDGEADKHSPHRGVSS